MENQSTLHWQPKKPNSNSFLIPLCSHGYYHVDLPSFHCLLISSSNDLRRIDLAGCISASCRTFSGNPSRYRASHSRRNSGVQVCAGVSEHDGHRQLVMLPYSFPHPSGASPMNSGKQKSRGDVTAPSFPHHPHFPCHMPIAIDGARGFPRLLPHSMQISCG